jgi:Domian of unknown function (DUF4952)
MMIHLLRQIPIVVFLALSWQIYTIKLADTPPLCENFLEKWGKNPPKLKFVGCGYEQNIQSDRSIAHYTVQGSKATSIESFLRENFQMAPLKFVCCGWEPAPVPGSDRHYGTYRDRAGYYYEIVMGSGETLEHNWDLIPEFHVHVTKFMSDI